MNHRGEALLVQAAFTGRLKKILTLRAASDLCRQNRIYFIAFFEEPRGEHFDTRIPCLKALSHHQIDTTWRLPLHGQCTDGNYELLLHSLRGGIDGVYWEYYAQTLEGDLIADENLLGNQKLRVVWRL